MSVGAELSKGRPKYCLLKVVDLRDFRLRFHWIVLDFVWVLFASQKRTLLRATPRKYQLDVEIVKK